MDKHGNLLSCADDGFRVKQAHQLIFIRYMVVHGERKVNRPGKGLTKYYLSFGEERNIPDSVLIFAWQSCMI